MQFKPPHIFQDEHLCDDCEFILDIYFKDDITHMWTKSLKGEVKHYPLAYFPIIYISKDIAHNEKMHLVDERQYLSNSTKSRSLESIAGEIYLHPDILSVNFTEKLISSGQDYFSKVLEVKIRSPTRLEKVVNDLKELKINMFNIDLNPRQQFFIDTKSRPMCACHISVKQPAKVRKYVEGWKDIGFPRDSLELVSIDVMEDITNIDYKLPDLDIVEIDIDINKKTSFPTYDDILRKITLKHKRYRTYAKYEGVEDTHAIEELPPIEITGTERQILIHLLRHIHSIDPDFIEIKKGDKFNLNYLAKRAKIQGLSHVFILGRLNIPVYPREQQEGQTYMTYGQVMHKDPAWYLPGRIHLDIENSFFLHDSGYEGLIELSRMSGAPPVRVSRASIGTVLTGIQMIENAEVNALIPPNKARGEQFKDTEKLLISDNGGLTYEARPGIYTGVWTIDFTSLYPFIMLKHNIGSETVLCEHESCQLPKNAIKPIIFGDYEHPREYKIAEYHDPNYYYDKSKLYYRSYEYDNIVPEVNYHICTKRVSVITRSMDFILRKRVLLKKLKKMPIHRLRKSRYKHIDSAMKWILVASFGYLGFKNARWGSIESHQSVTAYARRYLLQGKLIADKFGYTVIGGIVDSLFLQPISKKYDTQENMDALLAAIEKYTQIPVDCEGRFQWLIFCNVKDFSGVSALNRYFGYFDHDEYRLRGIRHRQRRATILEKEFQEAILDLFKLVTTLDEFERTIPIAAKLLEEWKNKLRRKDINSFDLIIKLKSGKGSGNYKAVNTHQAIVTSEYQFKGNLLEAGENMLYLVKNDKAYGSKRITIGPEVNDNSTYDIDWYIVALERAFLELLEAPQWQFFGEIRYDGKKYRKKTKIADFEWLGNEEIKKPVEEKLDINAYF